MDSNSTERFHIQMELRNRYYPIVVPFLITLCLLGVLANLYILACATFLRKSASPVMILTISLAAADGCVALFNLIAIVLNNLLVFVFPVPGLRVSLCFNLALEAFRMGTMMTAILHLFTIALNHYAGSLRPLHYQIKMTKFVLQLLISALWVFPTLGILTVFSSVPGQAFQAENCYKVQFMLSLPFRFVIFFLVTMPLVSMCLIYGHIFCIMVRRRKNSTVSESLRKGSSLSNVRNHKAVVTTTLILGTYIIGWVPSILVFLLVCNGGCAFSLHQLMQGSLFALLQQSAFNSLLEKDSNF